MHGLKLSWVAAILTIAAGAWLASPSLAAAQTTPQLAAGTVTTTAGAQIFLDVTFTAAATTAVSAIRFELGLPTSLSYVSVTAGAAATAAGKSASAAPIADGVRILVFGLNADAIGSGQLVRVRLGVASGAAPGTLIVQARFLDASDPAGNLVTVRASNGSVVVQGTTPVCGDGNVDAGETCDPPGSCPTSCNDGNACTTDALTGSAALCTAACTATAITQCTGGDGCCPSGCTTVNDNDCSVACGNGVIETGESCDPPGSCPTSCNDGNPCTNDALAGSAALCTATCTSTAITQCAGGDGCCAPGCNNGNDNDCSATCGNGTVDTGETCDPPGSCPTACDDGDACTTDTLVGSAAQCTAACTANAITQCTGGDGCCPTGCVGANDSDCSATCGNGTVDTGETCDPPGSCPTTCDDGNACTTDTLVGSAALCTAACNTTAITQCTGGDGCCPAGCTNADDSDCSANCGNGTVDTGETCDPPGSCPTTCNDGDACTTDVLVGSASQCTAACNATPITQCISQDGCCPAGCAAPADDDCSGVVCADDDDDGFGSPPNGCQELAADCDDSRAAVHPGAVELCNTTDDDCDGQIDEGFDLKTSATNCGSCGHACAASETCVESVCTGGSPTPGPITGGCGCSAIAAGPRPWGLDAALGSLLILLVGVRSRRGSGRAPICRTGPATPSLWTRSPRRPRAP